MLTDEEFDELTKDSRTDPFYALGFLESAAHALGDQIHSKRHTAEMIRLAEVIHDALTEAQALKRSAERATS